MMQAPAVSFKIPTKIPQPGCALPPARLRARFAAPVIGEVTCQDIKTSHMQEIVNAASTPGEGSHVQGMISAVISAGFDAGYVANPRLAKVHWRAGRADGQHRRLQRAALG